VQFKRGASAFQGMASGEEAAQIVMLERALHSERCDSFWSLPIRVDRSLLRASAIISGPEYCSAMR
jgi:hypothetical protein